jgi:hypothetical protein
MTHYNHLSLEERAATEGRVILAHLGSCALWRLLCSKDF